MQLLLNNLGFWVGYNSCAIFYIVACST